MHWVISLGVQILVLGGNGFVGTAICKRAVAQGISVVSLSRSGRPSNLESWVDEVTWISGKLTAFTNKNAGNSFFDFTTTLSCLHVHAATGCSSSW